VDAAFKDEMRKAVDRLHVMGGTNLWAGIEDSLKHVQALDLPPKFLKRVIMFTDGQPTEGVTNQDQILSLMGQNRGSVTVSSFGYGGGAYGCDQEFLTKLAGEGQGNYAYVQHPDDALTAFGRELGGLLSTYAQDIHINLEPHGAHRVVQTVTDITTETDPLGEVDFKFPDILSEETRHFVFEVELAKQASTGPRAVNLFSVTGSYSILNESGKRETKEFEAKAKAQFVDSDEAQKDPHQDLDSVIALAQVVRAQLTAEEEAKKGSFEAAADIMANVSKSVTGRGHANAGRVATSLQARLGNAQLYADSSGYFRSVAYGGTRAVGLSAMDRDAGEALLSCNVALNNSSMAHYTQAFVSSEDEDHGAAAIQQVLDAVAVHVPSVWTPGTVEPNLSLTLNQPQPLSLMSSGAAAATAGALWIMDDGVRRDPIPEPSVDDGGSGLTAVVADKSE
jgi:Ca-activated chloride channel family protein